MTKQRCHMADSWLDVASFLRGLRDTKERKINVKSLNHRKTKAENSLNNDSYDGWHISLTRQFLNCGVWDNTMSKVSLFAIKEKKRKNKNYYQQTKFSPISFLKESGCLRASCTLLSNLQNLSRKNRAKHSWRAKVNTPSKTMVLFTRVKKGQSLNVLL